MSAKPSPNAQLIPTAPYVFDKTISLWVQPSIATNPARYPVDAQLTGRNVVLTATIANGQSLSGEIDLAGYQMLAIRIPAAWDTANITFLGARATTANGGTYVPVYDDAGLEVTVTVGGADRMITLDINALKLASLQYIKLRSGTSGTPVNQTADRTLYLIGKV